MPRLTNADRDRLRHQLVTALAPSQAEAVAKLADAAAEAVMTDYYGAKTLKLFAAMPPEYWGSGVRHLHVEPTGKGPRNLFARRTYAAPTAPDPRVFRPSAATQAAIDAWAEAEDAAHKARKTAEYQVNQVLDRATTLESLLTLLPAARDILQLPAAQPATAIAATLNAALAARAPSPAPKPPAPVTPAAKPRKRA